MARLFPLTLLLPVKNASQFLERAIVQVEANLIVTDEVIVVDDGSEDSTLALLISWAHQNSQVNVVSNPGAGLVDALNFGVSISKHAWIARFDVDDVYDSSRLERQVRLLTDETVAIFSDYEFVDSDNNHLGYMPSGITPLATRFSLLSATRTPHPSVIFNKNAFYLSRGYLKDEFPAEDLGLWLRMSKIGKLASLGDALLAYRLHPKSITANNRVQSRLKKNSLLRKYPLDQEDVRNLYLEIPIISKTYPLNSHSDIRIILLIRELILSIHLIKGSKFVIIRSAFRLALGLSWLWPLNLTKFMQIWIRRRIMRRKADFART